jgi:hypothetical protein
MRLRDLRPRTIELAAIHFGARLDQFAQRRQLRHELVMPSAPSASPTATPSATRRRAPSSIRNTLR